MAENIKCYDCQNNTGYTTDTPVRYRIKSIVHGGGKDAQGEIHFCNTCWDSHRFNELVRPRETS